MKKRILPLLTLLCAALLCMTATAFAADKYTLTISAPDGTLRAGDSFTAELVLHGTAGEAAPSTLQVDMVYAGCTCTDAVTGVENALISYDGGRLCVSYLEQTASFDEKGELLLGKATFTAGSTNAVLTVSDSAALSGGEELTIAAPQAVTVAVSGATTTPVVTVTEDGAAAIDGETVTGTGPVYKEDTTEGDGAQDAQTGDTTGADGAAETDGASASVTGSAESGGSRTALWVIIAVAVIGGGAAAVTVGKKKGAGK